MVTGYFPGKTGKEQRRTESVNEGTMLSCCPGMRMQRRPPSGSGSTALNQVMGGNWVAAVAFSWKGSCNYLSLEAPIMDRPENWRPERGE
jgi:hypothetical protein